MYITVVPSPPAPSLITSAMDSQIPCPEGEDEGRRGGEKEKRAVVMEDNKGSKGGNGKGEYTVKPSGKWTPLGQSLHVWNMEAFVI